MNDLVGTWRLVESRAHDGTGTPVAPSYGPKPMGLVMFHQGGRMMCVLQDSRRELPPEEPEREYVSYAGNYTYDGKILSTRVDCTSDAPRMGSDQVRQVSFEGPRMVLQPPPRPQRGKTQHRELVWERLG